MKIKQKQPVRGEVYLCQFNPARGSEQAGTRPAVIVERTAFSSVAQIFHWNRRFLNSPSILSSSA